MGGISSSAAFIILLVGSANPAELGLALTYAFMLPYFLQLWAQLAGMLKLGMTSLERLLQCMGDDLPQEPPWQSATDASLVGRGWPSQGTVTFSDVSLIYRPGLPAAVRHCSFEIPGGSKVGVVGRTGAGKSSLFVLLFRLVDAAEGKIMIDGENVSNIGLLTLRRGMAIIPQEALLLEGSVYANIDPFGEHKRENVLDVLAKVGLGGLQDAEPRHLSAGQRQLLQMARTLVRSVRLVVMDEPTSNVDPNTDALMQRLVRDELQGRTVITIAHRLDTVIDADRVLVMEKGNVAEYGRPHELLASRGILAAMVDGEGQRRAHHLRQKAGLKSGCFVGVTSCVRK